MGDIGKYLVVRCATLVIIIIKRVRADFFSAMANSTFLFVIIFKLFGKELLTKSL